MVCIGPTLMTTILNGILVTALPWVERAVPGGTQALEVRAAGDIGLVNGGLGAALEKRALLIPFIAAMPAMVMASTTLGWCYRSTFDAACLALMAATIAMALSYAAVWWVYVAKYERVQWWRDDITQANNLLENQARAIALPEVLNSEANDRNHNAWKQEVEKERRTWGDPLKHALRIYENHDDVPEVKEKLDQAQEKFDLANTALEKFEEATTDSVEDVTKKVNELLRQHISYLDNFEELPFFQHQDVELDGPLSRRDFDYGMPRLLKETTENCDKQHCRRVWYSNTVPAGRKRGEIAAKDMIHNIYSTPADFHFETDPEHRSLFRRDDDNNEDDDLIECENTDELDDTPVISRISLVPGNDMDSLEQMVSSFLQDSDKMEKNFQNAIMDGNVTNFNSERWQCINADGDNGGTGQCAPWGFSRRMRRCCMLTRRHYCRTA
ncbi:hypothetical protein N7512_007333 [Penicillium capsulatum]|nr:hypothetical protein N7512_007333 [Penicillium capsulatum]